MAETYMGMPVGETVQVSGWDALPDVIKVNRFGIGNVLAGTPWTLAEIEAVQGMSEKEMIAAGYKPMSEAQKRMLLDDAKNVTSYYVDPVSKTPTVTQGNISTSMVTPIEPGMIGTGRLPKDFINYHGSAGVKSYGITPTGEVVQTNEPTTGNESLDQMIQRLAASLTSETGTVMGFGGRVFHYDRFGNYFESTGDQTASLAGQRALMETTDLNAGGQFSNAFTGQRGTSVPSDVSRGTGAGRPTYISPTAVTAASTVTARTATTATTATTSVTSVTTVKPNVTITGSQYLGSGANRILRTSYSDGTYTDTSASDITNTGAVTQDSATLQLLQSLQQQNAAIMAQMAASQKQAQVDAKAAAEAVAKEKQQSALAILTDRFNRYGLASLVPKIRELVISGANEDTIALQLQETDEYKQRFKANQERLKKGLAVLSPGDYIGIEDSYRQILRAYGLKQFDTDEYVGQFIANDVSTAELSSRVATAVQRVQNADPAITKTLRDFYGIGTTDLVAYVLDPNQQFQKIERQVAAAEIGTAARRQGLEAGVNVAEQLAAQGITQAEAQRGYATIADILPQAGKLSAIYTDVLDQYGQAEAEQEVFNSLASAQRKRRALVEREAAAFAGQTGLGRTSLSQQTGGLI